LPTGRDREQFLPVQGAAQKIVLDAMESAAISTGDFFSYVPNIEGGDLLLEINHCDFSQGARDWGLPAAGGCCYRIPIDQIISLHRKVIWRLNRENKE
jgi:hypothetical protein